MLNVFKKVSVSIAMRMRVEKGLQENQDAQFSIKSGHETEQRIPKYNDNETLHENNRWSKIKLFSIPLFLALASVLKQHFEQIAWSLDKKQI